MTDAPHSASPSASPSVSHSAVIEVVGLSKVYRGRTQPANDHISLSVERGQFLGVFGPNGAGKTTLVKQLVGLLRPTSGAIVLDGEDVVADPGSIPLKVGYYGQKVAALRHHTAREVLVFTGCLRGLSLAEARSQAGQVMDRFGMGSHADRRLSRQSGGEQRLAVLLSTFIGTPEILVLDEPTNELDPARRRVFWDFLREYVRARRATVVLTTHNLTEAEDVIDTVALIDQGRLVANDTLGALKRLADDRIRLELRLRPGIDQGIEQALETMEGSVQVQPGRWTVLAPRERVDQLVRLLIDSVGGEGIDDFRLVTPSLEDLYLQLTANTLPHHGR
ncbi:ABC transporter ATP-binding protein [Microlunatus endophyticus]|uniref:ABC transporter ATP-binding protein n=1 Tax=Microlunatus endophyticus TaxID=1716077 RepID=UPI00166747E2|nr:ABC transporter ATP-binding protein [Microlunatus endophyticus]